jgi:hypothetical protein
MFIVGRHTNERSVNSVPRWILVLLLISLGLQITTHNYLPRLSARAERLPAPPSHRFVRALSFGEEPVLAKLLMLWLQSFDNQPGISIPFAALDYTNVIAWLKLILALDPNAQYPLLAGSRIYAEVPDKNKQRAMLDFVAREFLRDPETRWPWMAHAVFIAKHRIGDTELALRYARSLAEQAEGTQIPNWARQMVIFVLEDMGELDSARVLLGGLLDSGKITDPHEQWFLSQRLAELEARLATDPKSE